MQLLQEMNDNEIHINKNTTKLVCKVFKDNSGALEIANIYKFCPRTKHINVKLHHFHDYVTKWIIQVCAINTKMQLADFLVKPANKDTLLWLRRLVMG